MLFCSQFHNKISLYICIKLQVNPVRFINTGCPNETLRNFLRTKSWPWLLWLYYYVSKLYVSEKILEYDCLVHVHLLDFCPIKYNMSSSLSASLYLKP